MGRDSTLLFIALAVAIIAAFWDIKQRRIPNWLTYPGIGLGVVLRGLLFGWKGLGSAVTGCLLVGGIMFLFYAVRAMGAGDVKLMAAIGSSWGPDKGSSCFWQLRFAAESWPSFMPFTGAACGQPLRTLAQCFGSMRGRVCKPIQILI